MTGFSAEWLALREDADRRARDTGLLRRLGTLVAGRDTIAITDLACGTGSTLRATAPHLPVGQSWRLVDHDAALLDKIPEHDDVTVATAQIDLAVLLEATVTDSTGLVTTSALLDLVSADWLDRLTAMLAALSLPLYAALTYDGRLEFEPAHSLDQVVTATFNRHMRGDKGFGPALGPTAAAALVARLEAAAFKVEQASSDWQLGPEDRALQEALIPGIAAAAAELGEIPSEKLDEWQVFRLANIGHMTVGHVDVLAIPPYEGVALKSQSNTISSPTA